MIVELPWGSGKLQVPVPDTWRILGEFLPAEMPPAANPIETCLEGLANSIGAEPLSARNLAGKRILLVPDDISRPTPVATFIQAVCDTLEAAGARREDIEILFALGVHRPMTEAEALSKIGPVALERYRWHNHDAFDPEKLLHLGTTSRGTPVWLNKLLAEFDLIIPLGAIEPHLLLGFSGGYKMLLPGCAGVETIGNNHLQGCEGRQFNYVGVRPDDSPMRLDLEEAVQMLGREVYVVNAAMRPDKQIVRFFCGCPKQALRTGVEYVSQHSEVQVPEPVDVVITNSAPFDADLRQSMKCVGNTAFAARRGGVVLGFMRCDEGRGDVPIPPKSLPYPVFRTLMHLLGQKRIMPFVNVMKRRDPIEQKFLAHFALQTLWRNDMFVYSDNLPPDTGKKLGMMRQYTDINRMVADAVARVGRNATVAVFPQGGCTFTRGQEPLVRHSTIAAAG